MGRRLLGTFTSNFKAVTLKDASFLLCGQICRTKLVRFGNTIKTHKATKTQMSYPRQSR